MRPPSPLPAAGATYLRNFTRLLVDELLSGVAADSLLQRQGLTLPSSWRAVAPGMSIPVPLADPSAAPWSGSARNLTRIVIQVGAGRGTWEATVRSRHLVMSRPALLCSTPTS